LSLAAASFPVPVLTLNELYPRSNIFSNRNLLNNKCGVYGFINLINGKIYIGSGVNIYRRFLDHTAGRSSNLLLQRAIKKYGLENFSFVVYEFCSDSSTKFETEQKFISCFPFNMLYNIAPVAGSLIGYKHRPDTKAKMKAHYHNKTNHSKYGKNHTIETKAKISRLGPLNPMFGKTHTAEARAKISTRLSNPVKLYNNNNQYILTFKNRIILSKFIGCNKTTISNYIKSGKCYNGLYYFRIK
jgi:group I intron endonuclease